jgi:hypothetical protein
VENEKPQATAEYTKPEIQDYGDLKELTAASTTGTRTDVPLGSPIGQPPFQIFS